MAYFYIHFRSAKGVRGVKREEVAREVLVRGLRAKGFIADLERRARSRFFVVGVLHFGRGRCMEGGIGGLAGWRVGGLADDGEREGETRCDGPGVDGG